MRANEGRKRYIDAVWIHSRLMGFAGGIRNDVAAGAYARAVGKRGTGRFYWSMAEP